MGIKKKHISINIEVKDYHLATKSLSLENTKYVSMYKVYIFQADGQWQVT